MKNFLSIILLLSIVIIFNGCSSDVEESIAPNEIPETITSENSQIQNENLSD
jgi:PBP1b-binding outer membrane lipoprotein LpoB